MKDASGTEVEVRDRVCFDKTTDICGIRTSHKVYGKVIQVDSSAAFIWVQGKTYTPATRVAILGRDMSKV